MLRIGCCAFPVGRVGPSGGRIGLAGAAGIREGGAVGVGGVLEVDEGGGATTACRSAVAAVFGAYARRFHRVRVWPRREAAARPRLSAPCSSLYSSRGGPLCFARSIALRAAASTARAPRLTFMSRPRDRAGPRPGRGAWPRARRRRCRRGSWWRACRPPPGTRRLPRGARRPRPSVDPLARRRAPAATVSSRRRRRAAARAHRSRSAGLGRAILITSSPVPPGGGHELGPGVGFRACCRGG